MKKKNLIWYILIWTVIISASFLWNVRNVNLNNWKAVNNKARALFSQIEVTRAWNSGHGGVYVPISETTRPNEYLEVPLRDVTTLEGLQLTKINPAFMTRQIAEINRNSFDFHFHITSLMPIRPQNKADTWETRALESFETGTKEVLELVKSDNSLMYKYIAPLTTKKSCLACHAKQGYKEGDIRGGISVSFPAKPFIQVANNEKYVLAIAHLIILALGSMGMWFLYRYRLSKNRNIEISTENLELHKANLTKDKFLSIISHDLKTPFNGIIGISELALDRIKDNDYEKAIQFIDHIVTSSKMGYNLLNNILHWTRLQTNQLKFEPIEINLNELEFELRALFLSNIKLKGINYISNIPNDFMVYADANILDTVLRNILANAIKFTKKDGEIYISANNDANQTIIDITDTGIGMSHETKSKLFDKSGLHSHKGTNNETGTGLGLLLSYELVKTHGGSIAVKSKLGKGTTVSVILPKLEK